LKMDRANGVDLAGVAGSVLEAASAANVILADKAWTDRGVQTGTAEQRWKTAELIKLAWRDANPDIVRYSKALEMTAREAVRAPGAWLSVRDRLWSEYPGCGQRVPDVVHYRKSGSFLQCRLPSGRLIYYPDARLGAAATPWGEMRATVIAKTEDLNSRWVDRPLNPGLLIENVVQAASCDVMTDAMRRVDRERPDMKIRLTIHDEIVASVALGVDALQDLCDILATPVAWAPGLPLAAAGWAGKRFRKE